MRGFVAFKFSFRHGHSIPLLIVLSPFGEETGTSIVTLRLIYTGFNYGLSSVTPRRCHALWNSMSCCDAALWSEGTRLSCISEHFSWRYFSVDLGAEVTGFLTFGHTTTT